MVDRFSDFGLTPIQGWEWGVFFDYVFCNFQIVSFFPRDDFIAFSCFWRLIDDLIGSFFGLMVLFGLHFLKGRFYLKVWLWSCFPFGFVLFQ